ncbi:MAG TPA: hypothetical protein VFN97_14930 [Actinospica sp.]|nr:hypothetical protein [Actinospica sp.]
MAGLREFFLRLRLAGAPGAPPGTAVPRDEAAERDAELDPVFGALAAAHTEAARVRAEAGARAAAILEAASREAAEIARTARESAPAIRDRRAAEARVETKALAAAIAERARGRAEEIRGHGAARVPRYAEQTVRAVDASLRGATPTGPEP